MTHAALTGGFQDGPRDAAVSFRRVLEAMSQPGRILRIAGATPPAPFSVAAGTVLLTLADQTTPVHLAAQHNTEAARAWIAFHTGAAQGAADRAVFAVGTWESLQPIGQFPVGTPEYPDRSTTVIAEVASLSADGPVLRGPGINGQTSLALPDVAAFAANRALFPLGLDFILTCGDRLACVPRSTRVGGG